MMVGIRPVADSLGRVNKLEVIPLEELGRPRVDVVVNCSGVFRDLFVNQMLLLDRAVKMAAELGAFLLFFVVLFCFLVGAASARFSSPPSSLFPRVGATHRREEEPLRSKRAHPLIPPPIHTPPHTHTTNQNEQKTKNNKKQTSPRR